METTDTKVESTTQTVKRKLFTLRNLKRGAIIGAVVAAAVWLKRKLNGSASVNAGLHVESADNPDN